MIEAAGPALLGALGLAGFLFGYSSQRGQFCLNSGFASAAAGTGSEKLRAFGAAVFTAGALLAAARLAGVSSAGGLPGTAQPLLALAIGGLILGRSFGPAGGCPSGIFLRLGEGRVAAIASIAGLVVGLWLTPRLPYFSALYEAFVRYSPPVGWNEWRGAGALDDGIALAAFSGLAMLVLRGKPGAPTGAVWNYRTTGLALGALSAALWIVTDALGFAQGPGILPGLSALSNFSSILELTALAPAAFVLAIAPGAAVSAWRRGVWKPTRPNFAGAVRAFGGGAGMGLGAAIAGGCTVGYGLALAPFGVVDAWLALAFMFVGRAAPVWRAQLMSRSEAHA